MSRTKTNTEAPASRIKVTIGSEDREIFMSFGLLNELARVVGDVNRTAAIDLDADLALEVMTLCLVPRDERGRPQFKDFEIPAELDPETAETILDWVKDHVLAFFIRRLKKTLNLIETNKPALTEIGSSLTGSASSLSKTA